MKNKIILFVGLIMFTISLTFFIPLLLEIFAYEKYINSRYTIHNVMEDDYSKRTQHFHKQKIQTVAVPVNPNIQKNTDNNYFVQAFINVYINNERVDMLDTRPITINYSQYHILKDFPYVHDINKNVYLDPNNLYELRNNVVYYTVHDKLTEEEQFVVLVNKTTLPDESLSWKDTLNTIHFTLHTISADGNVTTDDFSYHNRTKLQTKLALHVSPISFGYYTDIFWGFGIFVLLPLHATIFLAGLMLMIFSSRELKKATLSI
ncbi:hypothetical protein [Priestia taiwanensis]|uniref:Uncharacterized protein n=1 Tax=Priestia taiwanensis TaxID=1347902 RepID=A0A917ENS5_9BACI|nr:hypothetical protein [Priestia taiwanensis]MBM7363167.1 hypothetical protein [Priestia taiwanensis]GGE68241.1 hypothetical protein GCM10007140_17870 [Priestia taiwanensis]